MMNAKQAQSRPLGQVTRMVSMTVSVRRRVISRWPWKRSSDSYSVAAAAAVDIVNGADRNTSGFYDKSVAEVVARFRQIPAGPRQAGDTQVRGER